MILKNVKLKKTPTASSWVRLKSNMNRWSTQQLFKYIHIPHRHISPPVCMFCFRLSIGPGDTVIGSNECYCFSRECKSSNECTKHLSNELRLEVLATSLVRTLQEIWAMDRWIGFPMSIELETNLSWFHQPWRSLGWCCIADRSHLGCSKLANGEDYKDWLSQNELNHLLVHTLHYWFI